MEPHWQGLGAPFRRAVELAWESFLAGSLGIGAVVTGPDGDVVVEGRNRLFEQPSADAPLAGSTLAHAELDALSRLRWRQALAGEHVLWTSLEPCLQCAGAIRFAGIARVRYLCDDPICDGLHRLPEVSPFVARAWPAVEGPAPSPVRGLGVLLPMHVATFWDQPVMLDDWRTRFPATLALAEHLVASGELLDLAEAGAGADEVVAALGPRLAAAGEEDGHSGRAPYC
jgi:tRNA(Arg) A34 adenosine deaminase TadA